MKKRNTGTSIALVICALWLAALSACSSNEDIWGVNTKGQQVKLDPAKICWSTYESIPADVQVVADPVKDRFIYRPLDANAKGSPDPSSPVYEEIIVEDSGGCTCSCSTGHCSPALLQGSCVCVIQDGCSTCTRS